jgi:hypothetical protein
MSFHCEHRSDAEHDQNPDMRPVYQKRASIMDATPLLKQPIIARTATRVEKWSAAMRAILIALILLPTATLAQNTAPAKRPTVGGKPVVQVKPSAPAGCKLVGTVKGTKLWAGDCMASELRTTMPAEETWKPPPDEPVGAIPKGQQ